MYFFLRLRALFRAVDLLFRYLRVRYLERQVLGPVDGTLCGWNCFWNFRIFFELWSKTKSQRFPNCFERIEIFAHHWGMFSASIFVISIDFDNFWARKFVNFRSYHSIKRLVSKSESRNLARRKKHIFLFMVEKYGKLVHAQHWFIDVFKSLFYSLPVFSNNFSKIFFKFIGIYTHYIRIDKV